MAIFRLVLGAIVFFMLVSCSRGDYALLSTDSSTIRELDLSYHNLTTLPPSIADCKNLESISLVGNKLKRFPAELLGLPKLKKINVSFNEIDSLPPEVSKISNLEELNLAGNKVRVVPASLASIKRLRSLNISWNSITSLPAELAGSATLRKVKCYENLLVNPDSVVATFGTDRLEIDYCLDIHKAQYYLIKATQYHNAQNSQDAMAYYSKALSHDNQLAAAYGNRGLLKQRTGNIDGALADFDSSLQIDQQQPVIWLNRGVIRFNRGDKEAACQDWRNAAQLGEKQAAGLLATYCQ